MTNTSQHTTATTRDDLAVIAEYRRRPLDHARRILDAARIPGDTAAKRDYLRSTGSTYADSEMPGQAEAAFHGAVLYALESLARAYEQEITNPPALPVSEMCTCGWTGPGLGSDAHRRVHNDA